MKVKNGKLKKPIKNKFPSSANDHISSEADNESPEDSIHSSDEDEFAKDSAADSNEDSDQFESPEPGLFVRKRVLGDDSTGQPKKKKIKKNGDLYRPPTTEELNQLRETENLFHSNLFRLQIEEILAEVRLKEKYRGQFDSWFVRLKDSIESIPETEENELSKQKSLKKLGVKIPNLDVPTNQKGTYRFLKPSSVSVIGSYLLNATVGPNVVIDIMVEMPKALFQKHDYQDYRYHRKRSIYLSYVAANISDDVAERKTFFGEPWMPKLKIIPAGSLGKRVTVHVHVAAQQGSFKLNRFLPEKNSVRPSWFFSSTDTSTDDSALPPTPHYNAHILHDLTMYDTNAKNAKMIREYPNLRDGIILLKIWLFQRQPEKSYDVFSGHVLTMYVMHLLYEKKLNTFMSSYQIVRNVWNNLAQTDWSKGGITMCQDSDAKARLANYQKFYDCVFLDETGYHNLAANLSEINYQWLRAEAENAVKCLDNASIDSFQVLFMRRLPLFSTFDHFVCFHNAEALERLCEKIPADRRIDFGANRRSQVIRLITDLLKRGLGQRVFHIYVKPEEYKEWELTDKCPTELGKIFIGLQLNPEFCFNIIDKGPPPNEPEAAKFREFWENKSELRRFQDGLICEAVVWKKAATIAEKRMICKQILMFLLMTKYNISKHDYLYVGDQIDEFLQLKKLKVMKFSYGTGEEATLRALQVFSSLEKELTSLTDLPLPITGVQGLSPVFRYADVFPPLATVYPPEEKTTYAGKDCLLLQDQLEKAPQSAPAMEAVIQLSSSGKWPDELEAVRKTKAAFHIQIAECLRKTCKLKAKGSYRHVDIFKNGFVFRLEVAHQKELALLKQHVGEDGVIKYRDNDESIELEKRLFHLPKLSGALHGLYTQQPSFGPTCCLVKRWLSAQLIDASHFPEIVVELLVASIFLNPDPYKPAQMPQVAFFRLLEYFAREPWSTEAVIVNFNSEMTREDVVAVENHFGSSRETLPPLFIATPYDHQRSIWTVKNPTRLILNRIGSLAKEVLKLVEVELTNNSILIWKPMFKPPTTGYDILIRVKPELSTRRLQYFDLDDSFPKGTLHPYKPHRDRKIPIIEFNPVGRYLEELRANYDEFALFFHDTYGGTVIGVLLKPNALEKKDFKVSNMSCRKIDSSGKLVLNVSAMIEDFSIIGRGLVDTIDVQSKNPAFN